MDFRVREFGLLHELRMKWNGGGKSGYLEARERGLGDVDAEGAVGTADDQLGQQGIVKGGTA